MLALVTITATTNHITISYYILLFLNWEYFLKGEAIYQGTFVKICLQIVYGYGY